MHPTIKKILVLAAVAALVLIIEKKTGGKLTGFFVKVPLLGKAFE